mmetsp:Transcript_14949/g.28134  ORF Transcript_14949/g.28134 Transcript_14949/m.28134 type:complete len:648 (-) Transcript_14949:28-1971(-)
MSIPPHLPLYCQTDDAKWDTLHATAQSFIQKLDLPKIHPLCKHFLQEENTYWMNHDTTILDIPLPDHAMGPEYFYEQSMGFFSRLYTLFCVVAPALLAMAELWLRLFSCVIAPAVGTFLFLKEMQTPEVPLRKNHDQNMTNKSNKTEYRRALILMILGLASSGVLSTDTMYVQAHGRLSGGVCLCILLFLSIKGSKRLVTFQRRIFYMSVVFILSVVLYLYSRSGRVGGDDWLFDHPGIDIATIQEGLYYSPNNTFMRRVAELWPQEDRIYDKRINASPLPTGDSMTGIPFLVNSAPSQEYHRLWVQSEVDQEAVAIDIAFPPNGIHSNSKPIYLVLHGLNGGSHEEYVREFVVRRVTEGHTCIVMIARGLMDTPVFGWNVFHGARITDVDATAKAIRKGLDKNQMLAGVGYSMGAIILSNYIARSGKQCHLDCAMAISGGLDMRENLNFLRSMRLWQPMLAQTLKEDFIMKKFDGRFRQRLTKEQHLSLMRASSVSEVDVHAIVTYNGFHSLLHYYTEMSAMGDTHAFQAKNSYLKEIIRNASIAEENDSYNVGRIGNVSIPFCVMHALDDPLTTWRTMGHDPQRLVETGSGNIMMFLTKSGGHVGWPLGVNPASSGWKFMNDAVSGFVNSVDQARMEMLEDKRSE